MRFPFIINSILKVGSFCSGIKSESGSFGDGLKGTMLIWELLYVVLLLKLKFWFLWYKLKRQTKVIKKQAAKAKIFIILVSTVFLGDASSIYLSSISPKIFRKSFLFL